MRIVEFVLVHHGGGGRVEFVQCQYLCVGIVNQLDVAHKPAVAQRVGVALHLAVAHYYVACVEHCQHLGVDAVADVEVDDVLIATQFGSAVAAHLVVECRGLRIVEGIYCQIEHTIVLVARLCCNGVDVHIILCGLQRQLAGIADIVVAVQIAAVNTLQVDDDEQCQHRRRHQRGSRAHLFLVFRKAQIYPHRGCGQHHKEYAAPRVGHKQCLAVLNEDILYRLPLVAILGCHLVVGTAAIRQTAAHQQT